MPTLKQNLNALEENFEWFKYTILRASFNYSDEAYDLTKLFSGAVDRELLMGFPRLTIQEQIFNTSKKTNEDALLAALEIVFRNFENITGKEIHWLKDGIHARMPVILKPEAIDLWLSASEDVALLKPLFAPYDDDSLQAWQISKRVNSPANDAPELVTPV